MRDAPALVDTTANALAAAQIMERRLEMDYDPEPANLLHEAVEFVCERNPELVLMPYDQIKQAALELARQIIALRKCVDGN